MVVDELAEMDFGVYEGKSLEELKDDPEFGRWAGGFSPPEAPGGGKRRGVLDKDPGGGGRNDRLHGAK